MDVRETPITRVTPTGLQVGDKSYDLDVIVYATGFDAVTGSLEPDRHSRPWRRAAQADLGTTAP